MTTLIFDLESNGLLDQLDRLHCLAIKDADTGEALDFADQPGYRPIAEGLRLLADADVIAGHNVIGFDVPAIQKVYPEWTPRGTVRDTIVMARVIWPKDRLRDGDFARNKIGKFPGNLIGRHSLEAFGYRLGEYKGDFKSPDGWATWSPEMHDYMVQDVEVTFKLWHRILREGWSETCLDLEHEVATILTRQERHGFAFDVDAAAQLYAALVQRKADMETELRASFPPVWVPAPVPKPDRWKVEEPGSWVPKSNNKRMGYTAGAPLTKVLLQDFNPASRDHIADRLRRLGWAPSEFTDGGKPKVDETVLGQLPYPQAKPLATYLMVEKRLGQLAEGNEAWLKHVGKDGRIHGRIDGNGAVTGRMTHSKPNMAQVPAGGSPYGKECRALFKAGLLGATAHTAVQAVLVGCDADALELRCLAHFMARYDDGAYVKVVLEGRKEDGTDIHSVNARALGLDPKVRYEVGGGNPTGRDIAKVWFYAFIYGAGDEKLGLILGKAPGDTARRAGTRSRARFLTNLPALGALTEAVKAKAKAKNHLIGLDGRLLFVRSDHAALNTLLQSAGALVMKQAQVILDKNLQSLGLVPGSDYEFVATVHDEWELEAVPEHADTVGKTAAEAIRLAGEHFNFRCPLAGQYQIGKTWADVH
jgi:DNA polymerase I-like protein with 3'-5' exonuclease and polymerase domains